MSTEMAKTTQSTGVGDAALVMAVGIVVDRISRLSDADRADLYELVRGLREAKDADEVESIRTAMTEILDQEPVRAAPLSCPPGERTEKLNKWLEYVSGRIRDLRKHAGLTQEELAKASGLPQSHISRLENREHSPSRVTLEKIAKALKQPVGAFDPTIG